MARIRTVKPEFWKHEDLSELPPETHMLAAALLNYADDEGYFNANPKLIKADCCPLREDSMSITGMLQQLSNIGYIRLGNGGDGKSYGQVVKFSDHQTISHKRDSKIKDLVSFHEDSGNDTGGLHPEQGREGKGKEQGKETRFLFDKWYTSYPNKKDKGHAKKSWEKIKPDRDLTANMIRAVRAQKRWRAAMTKAGEFVPPWKNPGTWLNGECWGDTLEWPETKNEEDLWRDAI